MPTSSSDDSSPSRATKITSAFFDPFEIDDDMQFSAGRFAKISCSRSSGTSTTEKLTPVVSSESRDLFAVSTETDEFLTFPDPFASSQIDFQGPAERDLFNDASTWMTSSTLSTKFTNHEVNVAKTFRRGAFDSIDGGFTSSSDCGHVPLPPPGGVRPAHDKRPDEVFVRTPRPQYDALNAKPFTQFTSVSKPALLSESQWWEPAGSNREPFDPFAVDSTLHAFPVDKEQDDTDEIDKENHPIHYLPGHYAAAKANLRTRALKKVATTPLFPNLARKEGMGPTTHHFYKNDLQSEFSSSSRGQRLEPLSELGATKAAGSERKQAKVRVDQVLSSNSFVLSDRRFKPVEDSHAIVSRRLHSKDAVKVVSTDEKGVSLSTEDGAIKSQHSGFASSAALNSARSHLGETRVSKHVELDGIPVTRRHLHSETFFKDSTNEKDASPSVGATPPVAQPKGLISSAALNSTKARLEQSSAKMPKHDSSAGAPGSFLAERVEAARPEAVIRSRVDAASPTRRSKSDGPKDSSPIAANVKEIASGKALQEMLSVRFGKKQESQNRALTAQKPSDTPDEKADPMYEAAAREANGRFPLKEDPKYAKYFKMMKMGLPIGAVKNAMERDGLDPSVMDSDHSAPAGQESGGGVALKDDPKYAKYLKMMKMGLPMGAVKNAMERDGLDPSVMDGDHCAPAGQQSGRSVPLKDDPKYAKYMKMVKMGLPMGAVKNAIERDGLDPSVMDGDLSAPVGGAKGAEGGAALTPVPKDKYRRTRVHWQTHSTVRSNTIWAMVSRDPDVAELTVDDEELSSLFQAESKLTQQTTPTVMTEKGVVKVIDKKRANNGGITLARIKLTFEEIAAAVDC